MAKEFPPWFPLYVDDLMSAVEDFTNEELGIYVRLLCQQWRMGGLEPDRAPVIARCAVPQYVLNKFKVGDDGLLRNERLASEREKAIDLVEQHSQRAKKGAVARWQKTGDEDDEMLEAMPQAMLEAMPQAMLEAMPQAMHNSQLTTHNQQSDISEKNIARERAARQAAPLSYSADFMAFWQAYPSKIGKGAAWTSWQKAKGRPSIGVILDAIQKAQNSERWRNGYVPNPATWINQRRWEDEPAQAHQPHNLLSEFDDIPMGQ